MMKVNIKSYRYVKPVISMTVKDLGDANESLDHSSRRPRATKFQADRFYNFPKRYKRRKVNE